MKKLFISSFLLLLATSMVLAIDLEEIMKGNDFVGTEPTQIRWSPDGNAIYFFWKKPEDKAPGLYRYDLRLRKLTAVGKEQKEELPPESLLWNKSKTQGIRISGPVLSVYEKGTKKSTPLIEAWEPIQGASWSKDESGLFFMTQTGVYFFSLGKPKFQQLVRFNAEKEKAPEKPPVEKSAFENYLMQEEKKLIKNFASGGFSFSGRFRGGFFPPEAGTAIGVTLAKGENPVGLQVSQDDSRLIISLYGPAENEGRATQIPTFVTSSGYTQVEESRTKAGDPFSFAMRSILVSLKDKKAVDVKPKKKAVLTALQFSPSGRIVGNVTGLQAHDAWIVEFNAKGEEERDIFHQHDDAWIEELYRRLTFLPQKDEIITILETGDHLKLVTIGLDGKLNVLTGDYEVDEFELLEEKGKVLYYSSEGHPGIRNTYLLDLKTRKVKALTSGMGFHLATPSPDLKKLAVVTSTATTPPELVLQENGRQIPITRSPAPEFARLKLRSPEIVTVTASDGVKLYGRLLRPAKKNGAAVLFIHGVGYLQDAHFGWSDSYWREFLFGNLLLERGYTFFDVDYRGSAGYGRNFRTGIYGHMGGRDLDDLVDAARYLSEKEGIAADRIGLFGGSYGGFLTLMALFKYPERFACGAALRPVTDWAHYSSYFSVPRLGGKPQDVPDNYRRSSPIYFAEGLTKPLLILHGMADDNVHFQDSVRLAERLIELKKRDWWLTGFPSERHTFRFSESWLDEYRRILELFEKYLQTTN